MQKSIVRKCLVVGIIVLFVGINAISSSFGEIEKKNAVTVYFELISMHLNKPYNQFHDESITGEPALMQNSTLQNISRTHVPVDYVGNQERYYVGTVDGFSITLTRYVGGKRPSILLIHGMGCNHRIFDWDENHSLARFLNDDGWDVWMLDIRTHDGDGDFFFFNGSNREYINRYWDFDNTYLKIDVVTAVDFVKNKSEITKVFLSGHSMGGYLAYAYAMMIGQENLSGIITTGASPYATPEGFQDSLVRMYLYGFYFKEKAFVNPFGLPWTFKSKVQCDLYYKNWKPTANALFYYNTSAEYIQRNIVYALDSEPAGVFVDLYFGKHLKKYHGHWVDPQTLYDYSAHLSQITVPILFIAGDEDLQDPKEDIYRAYMNVGSIDKTFYSFPYHSHMDILLGKNASKLIFPLIKNWMNERIT